jgi:hypothetical protein
MKNFASASFFRIFDNWVRPRELPPDDPHWSIEGVDWTRTRQIFRNTDYGYSTEVFVGVRSGARPWKIIIVHEAWWVGKKTDTARTGHWAQLISGDRTAALAWFKAREDLGRGVPR